MKKISIVAVLFALLVTLALPKNTFAVDKDKDAKKTTTPTTTTSGKTVVKVVPIQGEEDEDEDLPKGLNVNKEDYLKARADQIGLLRGFDTAKRDSRPNAIAEMKSSDIRARNKARTRLGELRQKIRAKTKLSNSEIKEITADAQAGSLTKSDVSALAADASVSGTGNSTDLSAIAASAPAATWTPLGPAPVPVSQSTAYSGRVSAIAVHPTNPNIAYVGTAGGGLYRTLDGGATWTPLMDSALSLAIGAVTISPSNPSTVFVGTGESTLCGSGCFIGVGLYRIDNADTNPVLSNVMNKDASGNDVFTGRAISRIIVHPTNPNILFVGTASGTAGIGSDTTGLSIPYSGVFRTTNALSSNPTFQKLTIQGTGVSNRTITDLAIEPGNAARLYVALYGQFGDGGIYLSTNALDSTPIFTRTLTLEDATRAEFAINKVGGTITLYVATGMNKGTVYKSTDGGITFPTAVNNSFCGTQCFYDIGVAVDPNDANYVYLGGNPNLTFGRSTDGGTNFISNGINLHTDTQAIVVAPSNPNIVYFGSDGGIWKTTDIKASGNIQWTTLNNSTFSATEFMSIALHPTDRNFLLGGTQDNGTEFLSPSGTWIRNDGGDGGFAVIDQNAKDTHNVISYHTYYNSYMTVMGYMRSTSTDTNSNPKWEGFYGCGGTPNGISCNGFPLFYAPLVGGPNAPDSNGSNTLYYGNNHLYRSADQGLTMQDVSGIVPSRISAIAISPQNDAVRLIGTESGNIYLSTTAGATTMKDITGVRDSNTRYIGRLAIDPNNQNIAYAARNGFGLPSGQHVWKTTNLLSGSPTWSPSGNGIPDVPVDSFAINPNNNQDLFAGTDIGVFRSTDGGANWIPFSNGLPRVPVFGLEVSKAYPVVKIATHGRGIWEYDLGGNPTTCSRLSPTITLTQASQTGKAGDMLTYNMTVLNNDSSGCTSSTFNIGATGLPTGFTSSTNTITLAPAQSNTTTISITSPTSAVNGNNDFTITASDANHTASVPATYVVSNPTTCTRAAPTVIPSPTSQTGTAGQALTYAVNVKNNDSTNCTNSTFNISMSNLPTGFTAPATTITLAPQANNNVNITVTSPSTATNGNYPFIITASDANHTGATAGTSLLPVYVVSNTTTCTRNASTTTISPTSQTGTSGSSLSYTVTVTNRNSSTCGNSTFNIDTSMPSGFTANSPTVTLPSGGTGTMTVVVTSSTNVTNGTYSIYIVPVEYASNTATYGQGSTVSYIVSNILTCTRSNPTLTPSPTSQTGTSGQTLTYVITVKNNDSTNCTNSTFNITMSALPTGFTAPSTSITLTPQQTNTVNISITSPTSATNSTNNFTITTSDANHTASTTATYVVYNAPVCTRATPTISLNTSSQTGKAGDALTYIATIKNNDSAGCTSSTFTTTASNLPAGFSSTATSLTLSPAQTNTTTLTITSSSSSVNNTYSFNIFTNDSSVSGHSASVSASYVVNNPVVCSRLTPTLSILPTGNTGTAGSVQTYTAALKNNDTNCTNSTFTLNFTPITGWSGTFNPSTLNLSAGSTNTSTLSVTSPSSATNGNTTINISATEGNHTAATASTTYTVYNAPVCTRVSPTITLNTSSQTGKAGDALTYIATIKNNDSSACTSSTFTNTVSGLTGFTTPSTTLTLTPGQSNTTNIVVTSPSTAVNSTNNFTITTSDSNHTASTTATYIVSNPAVCTRSNPTLTPSPTSATGTAGQTLSYTITVKNNDSTTGCTNSTFTLTNSGLPSGFTGTFNPTTLNLVPGVTGTSTLSVTSPSNAVNQTANFTVTASDSNHSTSTTVSYIVSNPAVCTRVSPTITLNTSSQTGKAGDALTYIATIKNNDSSACTSSTFTNTVSGLTGFTAPSTSLTLTPGQSNTTNIVVTSPSTAVNSTNNFTITTSDANHTTSTTATYIVNNPPVNTCVRVAPSLTITPTSKTITPGQSIYYFVSIKNNDTAPCTSSTFYGSFSSLNGFYYSVPSFSITLVPGDNYNLSVTAGTFPSITAGTYSPYMYLSDFINHLYNGATATASVTVSPVSKVSAQSLLASPLKALKKAVKKP